MIKVIDYMNRLKMPAVISDEMGNIYYKNKSSREYEAFRLRKNLMRILLPGDREKYLSLCMHGGSGSFTLYSGSNQINGFVVAENHSCRWYFPLSFRNNLLLRTEELAHRGVIGSFACAEKKVISSEIKRIAEAFSCSAVNMIKLGYPDKMIPFKSFAAFMSLSSQLMFVSDRILLPDDSGAFILDDPLLAYTAAGEVLEYILGMRSVSARLSVNGDTAFFTAGDRRFYAGGLRISAGVFATLPYNYSKSDAASAFAASCSSELMIFRE